MALENELRALRLDKYKLTNQITRGYGRSNSQR
jgi:hypothetical protein